MKIKASNTNQPCWKPVIVKGSVPAELSKLEELARNMWWAWNHDARSLFRSLDEKLFDECGQNPVLLLERLSFEKMEKLTKDKAVLKKMDDVSQMNYVCTTRANSAEPHITLPGDSRECVAPAYSHSPR